MCWGSVVLTCDITQEWTSEDDLCRESPLSFYHVGSRDRTQVPGLGSKLLYPVSCLSSPGFIFIQSMLTACNRCWLLIFELSASVSRFLLVLYLFITAVCELSPGTEQRLSEYGMHPCKSSVTCFTIWVQTKEQNHCEVRREAYHVEFTGARTNTRHLQRISAAETEPV